jgi:biopolymer transport protein ExbD
MNRDREKIYGWRRDDLRTRYRPRIRIFGSLVQAAPWLSVFLIVCAFVLLAPRVVLRPGVSLILPESSMPMKPGRNAIAVILSHRQSSTNDARSEIIFFDDQPFAVDKPDAMHELRRSLSRVAHAHPETILIVEADTHVRYGTIVNLCTMASRSGLKTVNLAGRFPEDRPRE